LGSRCGVPAEGLGLRWSGEFGQEVGVGLHVVPEREPVTRQAVEGLGETLAYTPVGVGPQS
ncbi:hypothetical protein, partial [Streptomyces sp. NPDC055366]